MKKERREARNLILLLSSASFIAFLVVIGLVYYFGTSGTHLLRNVLVSPETLEKNTFTGYDPVTRLPGKFTFNKIEFVQAEKQGKGWGRFAVSRQAYEAFYKLVYSERSLPVVTDTMVNQFNLIVPSTLTIFVQGGDKESFSTDGKIFQQVQFIEGDDIFRVQFHPTQPTEAYQDGWIYFRFPGIYEQAGEFFAPTLVK